MTTDQNSDPGASATAGLPTSSSVTGEPDLAEADFARDTGATSLGDYVRDWWARVRGGEVGALPAILGLAVLGLIFSFASDRFLSVNNLANLVQQAGITVFIAMGLVFVLLLGEIDLSAGTASGVCAAVMGLTLVNNGDLEKALGRPTFIVVLLFLAAAAVAAGFSRLWYAVGIIVIGGVMMAFKIGTTNQIVAIFLAVACGVAIGSVTGFLVARIGIPSFVVTLALFLGWQGVLLQFIGNGAAIPTSQFNIINAISNGNVPPLWGWVLYIVFVGGYIAFTVTRTLRRQAQRLSAEPLTLVLVRGAVLAVVGAIAVALLNQNRSPNPNFPIEGMPYVLPLMIALMVFWTFVLSRVRFGRYVYAVGGNAEATRRAGVDLSRIRLACFAICSCMAAVGGIAQASRLGSIPSDAGGGNTLLYAVAAAVIGGTSLFGGRGHARDAVIGGFVIAMIPNGLGLLPSLPASANFIITALVLLLAASVDALSRRRAAAAGR
ncbi:MAG TPA: ABC transporter permease [Kineosporiaceae bacterium]|nr:ABC transporter permease [Kineosporiaceae bacterium]